jgi:putative ABC transport system permease protein
MFRRSLEIIISSFKMALQDLWKNKLRTFLSLFGITIGIFCIIGVLATVNSLEHNIQSEIQSLGTNTIYLDKWDYSAGGGPDYPWWKFINRPVPKYAEIRQIMERSPHAKYAAFKISVTGNVDYGQNSLTGVTLYGINDQFNLIQPIDISFGRYISDAEFNSGSNVLVVGINVAEKLFIDAGLAIDKMVSVKGKKMRIIGVVKRQGKSMIGGWNFDDNVILSYAFARDLFDEKKSEPLIMIQGRDNYSSKALKDELTGAVRAVHRLAPPQEDNFTLNDINDFSAAVSNIFSSLNLGGWAIAALSLIVGMFGVANIMFVSVKERTAQIGLKKAVGAKKRVILTEFLSESATLCIIGGLIGLTLVFLLTKILTSALNFPVFVSTNNMVLAIVICILVGIIAGFIPARQAARMNPVDAIRSK